MTRDSCIKMHFCIHKTGFCLVKRDVYILDYIWNILLTCLTAMRYEQLNVLMLMWILNCSFLFSWFSFFTSARRKEQFEPNCAGRKGDRREGNSGTKRWQPNKIHSHAFQATEPGVQSASVNNFQAGELKALGTFTRLYTYRSKVYWVRTTYVWLCTRRLPWCAHVGSRPQEGILLARIRSAILMLIIRWFKNKLTFTKNGTLSSQHTTE